MRRIDELDPLHNVRQAAQRRAGELRDQALDDAWARVRRWLRTKARAAAAPVPMA